MTKTILQDALKLIGTPISIEDQNSQSFFYVNVYGAGYMEWIIKYAGLESVLGGLVQYMQNNPPTDEVGVNIMDDLVSARNTYLARYDKEEDIV